MVNKTLKTLHIVMARELLFFECHSGDLLKY